jgi:hypothetical protein
MKVLMATVLGAALACAPVLAAAQPTARPVDAAPGAVKEPVTPAKLALVRRYLEAIHYENLADQMLSAMLPVLADSTAREHPNLTSEQRQQIVGVVRAVMREKVTPQIMQRMAQVYAETFTEPELRAIVAFYESAAGQAIMAKAPSLAPQAAHVVQDLMPEAQAEVARRVCEELRCDADPAPSPKAS